MILLFKGEKGKGDRREAKRQANVTNNFPPNYKYFNY